MAGQFRVDGAGRLTPAKQVSFTFDGKTMMGLEGDTLASALLANGVHLMGRSFKYHRPRGVLSAGAEEPNALVGIAREGGRKAPNVRATVQELYDGLNATSQNRWPSLAFDVNAINEMASPMFSAGFYYKTFMWPKAWWKNLYEPAIRSAAGLGVAPDEPDPDHYSSRYEHCDVLIIGGGLAGLAAALAAANSKASVILCDEQAEFGGSLKIESGTIVDGKPGAQWARDAAVRLAAMDNVRMLNRTTAFGYYAQNFVGLAERVSDHLAKADSALPRERLWQIRAGRVILAMGAIERHMVFSGNDRPGVMLASAGRTYLNQYGVAAGRNIGIYTANDSAYAAAIDMANAGIDIAAIVDCRSEVPAELGERARALGIEVIARHKVTGTKGRLRISSFTIEATDGGGKKTIAADALLTSSGWTPSLHLFSQSRGKVVWNAERQSFLPGTYAQDCISIGACAGTEEIEAIVSEALAAGEKAASETGTGRVRKTKIDAESSESRSGCFLGADDNAGFANHGKAFVDFQNDVTAKDIRLAVREGMRSIEHVKRFTTNGMASDQGKTSNIHGLAIAADELGKDIPEVGLTTFRPPYTPVTFGTIISHGRGRLFDVLRKTPIDGWQEANGAIFEDVGNWRRAWYYPQAGEDMHAAINRECRTVRQAVGMFDASTLGKIEVVGPDAAKFLEIMYTNPWQKLAVGRCRYGIMLREDGFIYDDGVVGRIAEDRFHVTTTTGGAARVLNMMEDYLQTEFPDLNVWLTSTSEQWAVIAVQGPKARDVIAPFVEGIGLENDAMAHMSVREGKICGVPTRLFRMSFTGEMGFEINVPTDFGQAVWEVLWAEGLKHGVCAYGTEAMHVLRAEKGYIIVGQDTDGTVTPHDAGLDWAIGKKKTDFVGIRGLKRPDLVADGRRQLVGLKTADPKVVLEEGAQIIADPNQAVPMKMIGFVTSSYWSENCGHSIAMALVEGGHGRMGETLYVPMPDHVIDVTVTEANFVDQEGSRLHG